jgi:hypothetical protein
VKLTERGQREVGNSLREAIGRLERREADLRAQMGLLEAELSDLGKIRAAIMLAAEMARKSGGVS